ncbi:uncharacterized protein K452DRAFT_323117 [Aplosporella prunicola CBS 121167]|uniref:AAA+ ATPase domain-containing protein n=1 Tax=Aplosporella prunicola CBS 121167 TaxID=1176127 RepID=A0A6A6ATJ9_9PEZI|nr:uncharacterized protein K452DRAFT_323117 [Aplosporella prunicola CBS 121167]KAF2135332.1 hypothetical protein K452DRAFT_323117 [Aplosporella prunicola CBS 121167]
MADTTTTTETPTLDDVLRVFSRPSAPRTEDVKTPKVQAPGELCRTKTLYEGRSVCDCCINWAERFPDTVKESFEKTPEVKQHAILARMKKSHGPNKKPLELDSIVIQSSLLKPVMEEVLTQYPGVTLTLQNPTFSAPFREFFHRFELLEKSLEKQEGDTLAHTQLLIDTLKPTISDIQQASNDLIQNGVITYEYLWTLFPPGSLVYQVLSGQHCVFEVGKTDYDENTKTFGIQCRNIDWDGKMFGWKYFVLQMGSFSGTKAIKDLEVYPFSYHQTSNDVEASLSARGRKFVSLRGTHYKAYRGFIDRVGSNTFNTCSSSYVQGRIVVDAETFFQYSSLSKTLKPLEKEDEEFSERHFLLCSAKVKGYSLETKTWGQFAVDDVFDIQWNENAFTDLVLPDDKKRFMLSMVRTQIHHDKGRGFDDIVEGKGEGTSFLLTGEPGVGKTLTAECVAEKTRTPLYTLSAGELGTSTKDVEHNLAKALDLSYRWKAILLLDESDVFLEQRFADTFERNQMVSIFLRMLEYQRGIVFLTSNRRSVIDKAFQSRIDFTLHLANLDPPSRLKIWKSVLQCADPAAQFSDEQTEALSQHQLNGREIRNAVKSAQLLATDEGAALSLSHVDAVLRVTQEHRKWDVPKVQASQDQWKQDIPKVQEKHQDQASQIRTRRRFSKDFRIKRVLSVWKLQILGRI